MEKGQFTESILDLSLPDIGSSLLDSPIGRRFECAGTSSHAPRFLLLYGSLSDRSANRHSV
jgi:arsenic resistance protein ArsH